MKRPEINWTATATVLTGVSVIIALGSLQFSLTKGMVSLTENMGARLDIVRSDILTLRSDVSREIGALRSEVREEIGALRSEVGEEFAAVRAEVTGEINALRSRLQEESMFNQEMIHDLARGTASLIMNHEHASGLHRGKILPESRADDDAPPPDEE